MSCKRKILYMHKTEILPCTYHAIILFLYIIVINIKVYKKYIYINILCKLVICFVLGHCMRSLKYTQNIYILRSKMLYYLNLHVSNCIHNVKTYTIFLINKLLLFFLVKNNLLLCFYFYRDYTC